MRLILCSSLLILALVTVSAATASASSIVTNGDFQTGDFTGWTVNTAVDTNHPWEIVQSGSNFYASTGCEGPECIQGNTTQNASLIQLLNTVAGQSYTLTFDYSGGDGTPNALEVDFGNTDVVDLHNTSDTISTYTYTVLATSNATFLEFLGEQVPSYDYLDNISVTANSAATPEPASLALFGSGLLGFVGIARRRTRRQ